MLGKTVVKIFLDTLIVALIISGVVIASFVVTENLDKENPIEAIWDDLTNLDGNEEVQSDDNVVATEFENGQVAGEVDTSSFSSLLTSANANEYLTIINNSGMLADLEKLENTVFFIPVDSGFVASEVTEDNYVNFINTHTSKPLTPEAITAEKLDYVTTLNDAFIIASGTINTDLTFSKVTGGSVNQVIEPVNINTNLVFFINGALINYTN